MGKTDLSELHFSYNREISADCPRPGSIHETRIAFNVEAGRQIRYIGGAAQRIPYPDGVRPVGSPEFVIKLEEGGYFIVELLGN